MVQDLTWLSKELNEGNYDTFLSNDKRFGTLAALGQ